MKAKTSLFVFCVKATNYFLLHHMHDRTFESSCWGGEEWE